jgi:hypothetical protein
MITPNADKKLPGYYIGWALVVASIIGAGVFIIIGLPLLSELFIFASLIFGIRLIRRGTIKGRIEYENSWLSKVIQGRECITIAGLFAIWGLIYLGGGVIDTWLWPIIISSSLVVIIRAVFRVKKRFMQVGQNGLQSTDGN